MSTGSTKLQYGLKNLRARWEETKESWSDQVSEEFDRKHLNPMETQVSATIRAMEKLGEIIAKVRRDCS
jgi:hypothetical protein